MSLEELEGFVQHNLTLPSLDHHQWLYAFDNQLGASMIINKFMYGYELAVINIIEGEFDSLNFATDVAGDVIPNLTFDEVEKLLKEIKALPNNRF